MWQFLRRSCSIQFSELFRSLFQTLLIIINETYHPVYRSTTTICLLCNNNPVTCHFYRQFTVTLYFLITSCILKFVLLFKCSEQNQSPHKEYSSTLSVSANSNQKKIIKSTAIPLFCF